MDKKKNIVTRSVAFNLDDPDQLALYEHAKKRTNFSAYMKRLITMDILGIQAKQSNQSISNDVEFSDVDFDQMDKLI